MAKTHLGSQYDEDTLLDDEVREPRMYRVLLHNDDYTSMDFVIYVLVKIFRKNAEEAEQIMLAVHERGLGLCGMYTREIAEAKVMQVRSLARDAGFPLLCTYERVEE